MITSIAVSLPRLLTLALIFTFSPSMGLLLLKVMPVGLMAKSIKLITEKVDNNKNISNAVTTNIFFLGILDFLKKFIGIFALIFVEYFIYSVLFLNKYHESVLLSQRIFFPVLSCPG